MQTLYFRQSATVLAGAESREFALHRGVKQGDPISSLLFLAVMAARFKTLMERWCKLNKRRVGTYYGLVVDDPADPLLNLLFADDVLLFGHSSADIRKMLGQLADEAGKYGLKINFEKTKVLATEGVRARPRLQDLASGGRMRRIPEYRRG